MVRRALPFAFLLILAINLGSENAVAASQPAAGSESFVFADADCSGAVDSLDALLTLRAAAGLGDNGCSAVTDANCDAGRDAADTVEILRQGGGLGVTVAGCPPPGTSLAAVDPDPALVTAVLSDQLQVMQSVGPDGGQVIATGEDGTTYTLSVPAGALAVEESITLTPLASLGGFPLGGGMSGGVVIGPEDLLFTTPATVTISPSQAPAGEQLIGFGLRGDEFFFYPMLGAADPADLSAQGAPIRLPYIGPGGYGVGSGSTADIEAQQDRSPSQPEDQLARSLDEIFREHDHSSPEFDAALEIALRQYYLSGLIGGLQYAPDDCDVTRGLLVPFAKWLGLIQGFISNAAQPGDLFYDERSIMDNGLALGVANCFNETYERCRDNPNAEDAFLTMKYAGILQSGLVGNPDLDSLLGDWLDKINECTPQPCTVTDCRWVGSAHAEVYYFPSGNNQTFSIALENLVFEYVEGQDPGARYQTYELVSAGPLIWEASGTDNDCTYSGTMTLDPPGSGTEAAAGGQFVEDTEQSDYDIYVSGHDHDARYTASCPDGDSEQLWPVIAAIYSGSIDIPFNDPGTNTVARNEYYDPSEFYGGRWTWDLHKVQ